MKSKSTSAAASTPPSSAPSAEDDEFRLIELAASCARDPLRYVKVAYPWGEPWSLLEKYQGPDDWQAEVLAYIRDNLGKRQPIRIAVAGGVGPGKSALMAWIINWGMTTCVDTRCRITANTGPQLTTSTWPEISKWLRMSLWAHWFEPGDRRFRSIEAHRKDSWRCDAITWDEHQPEAFAGFHNAGRRIIYGFDESAAIATSIFQEAEGILAGAEDTDIIWLCLGNPTRTTTHFRTLFAGGKNAHLWKSWHIDTRTARMSDKAQIKEWIDSYGMDSDFVRVRVLSQFPRSGSTQFISADVVAAAQDSSRDADVTLYDPLVMGVDVARFGNDKSVIRFRRGRDARSIKPMKFHGLDTMQLAARVAEAYHRYQPDAVFIDAGGPGAGVVDRCNYLRLPVMGIDFGSNPDRDMQQTNSGVWYYNKRAEMWGRMKDWLTGGMIDDDKELAAELPAVEYGYAQKDGRDCVVLEKKEHMRKRGLASPDDGDALCFVAGTLIQTPIGKRPIESLSVGDEVTTPFGSERVAIKWARETTSLTTADFSNGKSLTGRGEHRIFVWGYGVCRLDALPLTIAIEPYSRWRLVAWRALSMCCTVVRNIGFKQAVDIISRDGRVTPSAFFIGACGLTISAIYQRALRFITSTGIGEIMRRTILSFGPRAAISLSICESGYLIPKREPPTSHILRRHKMLLALGTPLPTDAIGTALMESDLGRVESQSRPNVRTAEKHTKHSFNPVVGSVLAPACRPLPSGPISRISELVRGVASSLWRTAIARLRVVPVYVATESVPPRAVYNLTLERHNAYYANDILVFNCLTFAHPVAPTPQGHKYGRGTQGQYESDYDALKY